MPEAPIECLSCGLWDMDLPPGQHLERCSDCGKGYCPACLFDHYQEAHTA